MTPADLPAVNAGLNLLSAVCLTVGYYHIRSGRQDAHRRWMLAAFVSSTLFLGCYLFYHWYVAYYLHRGPTVFRNPPGFRPVYLFILLTHTVLAALVVPMALTSLFLGLRGSFKRHKRISRWTWPVWMYVSATGVLIYLLLYQVFPQNAG